MTVPPSVQPIVSRETLQDLEQFADQVRKWNKTINLIAPKEVVDIWFRHIWDSVQLFLHVQGPKQWIDLGSGGGFPGIVLSLVAKRELPELEFLYVESDKRKTVFLKQMIQRFDLRANVKAGRVEETQSKVANVISARGLAPLDKLLSLSNHLVQAHTSCLFPKGQNWQREVDEAQRQWKFELTAHKSITSENSAILELRNIVRR